jgi:outer membrane protein assembly factor BamE
VVTSKMLLQLRPGMTKSQVRFIMGTPLVVDSFHPNRWDYFYQMRQAGKVVEKRRVILDFDKEVLLKVRGDVVPQGTAGADAGADAGLVPNDGVTAPKSIETQPKKEEGGLLDKLMFWKKDSKTAAAKPAAPVAPPVAVTPIELPSVEAPAEALVEDVPSVLAVPIALPSEPEIVATPKAVEPKVEAVPTKAEAAKLKAAKKEAAKLEAANAKAAKIEAAKQEAAKAAEAKQEAAKMKAAKMETAKLEAAQAKTAKLEAAKQDAAKQGAAKQEAVTQETAKSQAMQAAADAAQAAAIAAAEPSPPAVEAAPIAPAKPASTRACYRAECDNYKAGVSVSPAVSAKP